MKGRRGQIVQGHRLTILHRQPQKRRRTGPPRRRRAAAEPKDVVLQRAVQLYRALLVLGKLPRT